MTGVNAGTGSDAESFADNITVQSMTDNQSSDLSSGGGPPFNLTVGDDYSLLKSDRLHKTASAASVIGRQEGGRSLSYQTPSNGTRVGEHELPPLNDGTYNEELSADLERRCQDIETKVNKFRKFWRIDDRESKELISTWLQDAVVTRQEKEDFLEVLPDMRLNEVNAFWKDIPPDFRRELLTHLQRPDVSTADKHSVVRLLHLYRPVQSASS